MYMNKKCWDILLCAAADCVWRQVLLGGNVWGLPCVSCSHWCGLPVGVMMMNGLLELGEVFMTKRRCCM